MFSQLKNNYPLSFLQVSDILSKIGKLKTDKEKAKALKMSQPDYANRKKREAIPYANLIEWALANKIDINLLFTDRDISWQETQPNNLRLPRGAPSLEGDERRLLEDALEILRAVGPAAEFGKTLKQTIKSCKQGVLAQKKIVEPSSKKAKAN